MNRHSLLLPAVLAACLALLVACGGSDDGSRGEEATPRPAERASHVSPKPTREPTPEPTPAPAVGWTRHITPDFEIDLPDSWETWEPTRESDEASLQALETVDAQLAEQLQQLWSGPDSPDQTFAAFDTGSGAEFLTNFGIYQQETPLPTTVRAQISAMEEQVHDVGGTLLSTNVDVRIDGGRAGSIEYALSCACGIEIHEIDYVVLPKPTRFIQLSFAARTQDYPALKRIFEQIAESFRMVDNEQ